MASVFPETTSFVCHKFPINLSVSSPGKSRAWHLPSLGWVLLFIFGWFSAMLQILSPQLEDKLAVGCRGKAVAKASPALGVPGSSAQAWLTVSSVENRNDTLQGKGAAGADGGSLVLLFALGRDSGEGPLSGTGMRILPSHHKGMRSHPGCWRQRRAEGPEPLSSGPQRFWGREQSLNGTLLCGLEGTRSSSPAHLFRLAMWWVCSFFKFAIAGLFPQLDPAWDGAWEVSESRKDGWSHCCELEGAQPPGKLSQEVLGRVRSLFGAKAPSQCFT